MRGIEHRQAFISSFHRGRVRKANPGQGPPFPVCTVEEALGFSVAGSLPPAVGADGGVCLARNHPSLNFSPHPGLVPALSEALSLAPHQAHFPCENSGLSVVPPPWLLKQHRNTETYRSQLQAGSPACKQYHSFRPVERSSNCAPSQEQDRIGRKFPLKVQSVRPKCS